ncbi:hypothetical protein ACFDTO_00845 [Microbacteriaceae bacterium 4G12]
MSSASRATSGASSGVARWILGAVVTPQGYFARSPPLTTIRARRSGP